MVPPELSIDSRFQKVSSDSDKQRRFPLVCLPTNTLCWNTEYSRFVQLYFQIPNFLKGGYMLMWDSDLLFFQIFHFKLFHYWIFLCYVLFIYNQFCVLNSCRNFEKNNNLFSLVFMMFFIIITAVKTNSELYSLIFL